MSAGGEKAASYHAPPFTSTLSGATIHELRCIETRIQIGFHLVPHIVQTLLAELPSSAYVLVTDTNLASLGAVDKFQRAFAAHGARETAARLLVYELPPGEESKSRATKAAIEDWMLDERLTRDTVVLALGGGVIGDLTGFVAATFMRGLKYVQIPTTLLAMVDSAVGGKTAIDHPHGKNLLGAFHQPQFVFVDAAWLLTLPAREFSNGMAEVVKTAAIWDGADFAKLETASDAIRDAVLGEAARAAAGDEGRVLATRTPAQSLLLDVIRGSIGVKAHIVTVDEKETGLRNLVNFGHSVGHAIEAVLTPDMLHGECVAVGMVLEAEIARAMNGLPQAAISRLVRCLQLYGLPVMLTDARIAALARAQQLTAARLLDIMRVDKKNAGAQKKIVLLAHIGGTAEDRASSVPDDVIVRVLAPAAAVQRRPPDAAPPPPATLATPGSKSVSNRALVMAALSGGTCRLRNLLHSDDTHVMMAALRALRAADFAWEDGGATLVVHGHGGAVHALAPDASVYLQNAGTAARFITAVCALQHAPGAIALTGNARMRQRPIGPLVDALRANGTRIEYTGTPGCLPLAVHGGARLAGGHVQLAADVSSQYVSAVLLCAPYAASALTLELVGDKVISQPYIDMTVAMMRQFGVHVQRTVGADGALRNEYRVPPGAYRAPAEYHVESDASSATYPLALAAITGTTCTVSTIGAASLQGDAHFATAVLRPMGCKVAQTPTSTTVTGPQPGTLQQLGALDMEPMTDAFITAAVLFAVAQGGSTAIHGIANQRVKECDRLRAVVDELARFGVRAQELDDGVRVFGTPLAHLRTAVVHCYDDHRIAMAFSVLAAVSPGATLLEKRCVEKTWPAWWDALVRPLAVDVAGACADVPLVGGRPAAAPPPPLTPAAYHADATVVCIGMRASGKSHIGRRLAALLSRTFIDADDAFSRAHDLAQFVRTRGWDAFRAKETRMLAALLHAYPRGHVLALGGGVVESADARALLRAFAASAGPVVHVVRDVEAILAFLATSDRPAYGAPVAEVYARRLPWYRACASMEAENLAAADGCDGGSARALARALAGPLGTAPAVPRGQPSFFLSLTFPDVRDAVRALPAAAAGADVLELRVDLLDAAGRPSPDRVRMQVAALRAHTALPVLFTVRSVSQGGCFPDGDEDAYFALVHLGLRLGCEYVDVEITRDAQRLAAMRAACGRAALVASWHDVAGTLRWTSPQARRLLAQAADVGHIAKLVGRAEGAQENVDLELFRADARAPVPLIAINMGEAGQLSRVLNEFLTPVTHPALPAKAAPGQLSVREILSARHLVGVLPARRFFLFGTPIAHSLSPLIHNTGFDELGLPHTYALHECAHVDRAVEELVHAADFGGASVTIPHKRAIMPLLDSISHAAAAIGAVNTIVPRHVRGGTLLHGENTDWCAIEQLARAYLPDALAAPDAAYTALVIGAGGSARAALYAMHRLGAARILLFNRTHASAVALADAVPAEWHVEVVASLDDAASQAPAVLVSNVPAAGVALVAGPDADIVLPPALLQHSAGGIVIDMAYKPAHTALLELVAQQNKKGGAQWHGVRGLDILLAQAFLQFRLWTGLRAPEEVITLRAWEGYGG
ncbi:hypothetical protein MSPP1_001675 [Malassezia sp. CBS 17886]|nr:hypothetical protein MSPP1_001675 [Malassezia sp. CBS 17886]